MLSYTVDIYIINIVPNTEFFNEVQRKSLRGGLVMGEGIFSGEIVGEVNIPRTKFRSAYERKDWGKETLGTFVASFHGLQYRNAAHDNGNHAGRLTGIQIVICNGDKEIIYALIEPREKYQNKILITKVEHDLSKGSILDAIDYEFRREQPEVKSPLALALEKAGALDAKKSLPKKEDQVTLLVNHDLKKGVLGFVPHYFEKDPVTGEKTMRIFHAKVSPKELELGQQWQGCIHRIIPTEKANKNGHKIIHVEVEQLRKAS